MIIYEATAPRFIELSKEPKKLAAEILFNLKEKFGIRVGESEIRSWTLSLPRVAKLLKSGEKDFRRVLIEFNIPNRRQRVDFIILGKDKDNKSSAWILELKQWSDVKEIEWNEFRVARYTDSHPSMQAAEYMNALQHEMGMEKDINFKASAYLHNLVDKESPLLKSSYNDMMAKAALYWNDNEDILGKLIEEHTINKDGTEALEIFKNVSDYAPTKHFKEILEDEFKNIELIGTQKIIYEKIERFVKEKESSEKITFLISGDPGSGKSVIAFKLLILLAKELEMKIQLMLPGQEVRDAFKNQWKNNVLSHWISGSAVWKGYDAAIIDEAHKAISRDTGLVNYRRMFSALNFAIIFIDDDQVINRKGITKKQVMEIAVKNGHKVHEYVIEETFRNFGERTLLDWIDYVFYQRTSVHGDYEYKQEKYINKNRNFKLFGYKSDDDFINCYYKLRKNEESTRMTSLWHKKFYIGPAESDGEVPRTVPVGKYKMAWNPNQEWMNKQSIEDKKTYSRSVKMYSKHRRNFLMGEPHPDYMAYFNHIQGYEFDNIFVYIPDVFTFEDGEILFHRSKLAKEVLSSQTWSPHSKSKELNGRDPQKLNKRYFINRIKVMLTRGKRSTHVFAEDEKLNDYILNTID